MTTLRGFGQFEMITWYKIFQHSMHLCWYAAISQGVLIQFAVITTLQNSPCGTVEGHVFRTCPCLTLSNLGGKPTVMHVVGSAMDIFWTWATFEIYSTSNETATFNIITTVSPQARGKVTNTSTVVGDSQKVSPPCTWGRNVTGTFEYNCGEQEKGGALKAVETRRRKQNLHRTEKRWFIVGYAIRGIYWWSWTVDTVWHLFSLVSLYLCGLGSSRSATG